MARVTVEDCAKHVKNKFLLTLAAAQRTKLLNRGAKCLVAHSNNKTGVAALREFAEGCLDYVKLVNDFVYGTKGEPDSVEEPIDPIECDGSRSFELEFNSQNSAVTENVESQGEGLFYVTEEEDFCIEDTVNDDKFVESLVSSKAG